MEVFELMGRISIETSEAESALDGTVKNAKASGSKLSGIFGKIGTAAAAAFAAKKVVEFGVACVKTAAKAETAFAKVNTLLSGDTDTAAYFDSIRDASRETAVNVADFAEAVYQAISASVDQASAVEFTTQAVKLAKGGFTDTATAVDVLTTAINAYGLKASDATAISNKLITTQNLGKTTVAELAAAMGRVIPTAKSFNVDLDTLCGAYAIMTKNGIATAESTTYLNGMLNELGKSGTVASDILKNKTGKSFSALMASGYSLSDALGILRDEANSSGKAIGDMFGSQEAAKAANVLIDNVDDFNASVASMQDSTGAAEAAYETMIDTMAEKTQKLKNNWDLVKEAVGSALEPVTGGALDLLNGWLEGLLGVNQFKGVAESYEDATEKAAGLRTQIEALYEQLESNAAVGLDISNISGQISLMEEAVADFDRQAEDFKNSTKEVADSVNSTETALQEASTNYVTSVQELMDNAVSVYNQVSQNIEGWFSPFQKVAKQAKVSLKDMTDGMQSQIDYFTTYNQNIQTLTEAGLGSFANQLQSMGADGAAYAQAIVDAMNKAGGATSEGGQQIVQNLTGLQTQLEESQDGLTLSMTEGITGLWNKLTELNEQFGTEVGQWDKSGDAQAAAAATMSAFRDALAEGGDTAVQAMSGLGSKLTSALQASIGTVTMTVNVVASGGGGGGRGGNGGAARGGGGKASMVAFGHKDGLDYVPYDEYPARLHKGEAVLTAAEARAWRAGKRSGSADAAPLQHGSNRSSGSGVTIVQNIQAVPQTPAEIAAATAAYWEIARWAM